MTYCEKCDSIPEIAPQTGTLFLWPPVAHTTGKILAGAKSISLDVEKSPSVATLAIKYSRPGLRALIDAIAKDLLPEELVDTKALIMPENRTPEIDDIARLTSLNAIRAAIGAEWLGDLLRDNRLNSVFQPIFPINNFNVPFAHECLIRGAAPDGTVINPGQLFDAAQSATLLFQLDRAARAANVRNATKAGINGNLFINFTPSSIYDPDSCLRSTIEVVEECELDRKNVVFEVIETEKVRSTAHLSAILESYRSSGFRVALDDVGSGYSTLNLLPELRPDIIKIDRELVDHVDHDNYKQAIVSKLIALAKQLEIEVIAEGIERQEELDFLIEHDVDYVQGFLLGRPANGPFVANPA
ncbi:EAL domain-containing protein [Thalassospira sp. CH_XMU1448-2]|uniref:EAL domain-containing protein n=1 Tax=Thalassospira sp. CH_XMU1448-2 TaxID=3107773 RepID=UPI0030094EBD